MAGRRRRASRSASSDADEPALPLAPMSPAAAAAEASAVPAVLAIETDRDALLAGAGTSAGLGAPTSAEPTRPWWAVDRRLLPAKAVFLTMWACMACVAPFLSVILNSRGLTPTEVGWIAAIRPLASFVGAPIFGALADRWHAHRVRARRSTPPADGRALTRAAACTLAAPLPPLSAGPAPHPSQPLMMGTLLAAVGIRMGLLSAATFATMAAVVLASDFVGSAVSPLVDHAVLDALGPRRGDYGKQRLYGAVGWGIAALVVGAVAEAVGQDSVYLYAQLAAAGLALWALWHLPVPRAGDAADADADGKDAAGAPAKPRPWAVATLALHNAQIATFFVVVFVMGALMGQITIFLFVWLAELGGRETLFGLCLALTCVSEIPAFYFAGNILRRFGTAAVIQVALGTYVVRFVYYALLTTPWAVLPAELMHGITYALSWAACTDYAAHIAPPGLGATVQGTLAGVHWGLGQAVGAALGGLAYDHLGPRASFGVAAAVALGTGVLFALATYCRRRARHAPSDAAAGGMPPPSPAGSAVSLTELDAVAYP